MPFNPNEPQNGETVDADLLRAQLNALNDKFAGITLTQVLTAGNNAGGQPITGVGSLVLGTLGVACIQMYANTGSGSAISIESQTGNQALLLRAGDNPGDKVGLTGVNAPLILEGATGVQLRAPLLLLDLPTADPGIVGAVWNEAGTLKISAG